MDLQAIWDSLSDKERSAMMRKALDAALLERARTVAETISLEPMVERTVKAWIERNTDKWLSNPTFRDSYSAKRAFRDAAQVAIDAWVKRMAFTITVKERKP